MSQNPLQPTTTAQQDLTIAGQRRINLIWEITQALIALVVTASLVYVSVVQVNAPDLKNAFFLIVGFYFSRTNHQAIGGMGRKQNETQDYQGR